MLKPKVKIIIALCIVLAFATVFWLMQKFDTKRIETQVFDTLHYDKQDYDLMRAYYHVDTAFQNILHEKMQMSDSSAFQLKKLSDLPYELRHNSEIKENDIKAMIFAYRASQNVLDKFADIDRQLKELEVANAPRNAEDSAIQRSLDSMRNLAKEGKLK